jgi:putative hemolysin
MVPRAEIEAMEVDDPVEDLRQRFIDSGMSKLLIYKDNLDNILGYVHGYELFRNPRTIRAVMRPVNFIPGTMPADEALQMFIKQRTHVAVVVDEFGGTAGMLTMEDVVETIVGRYRGRARYLGGSGGAASDRTNSSSAPAWKWPT